MVLFIYDLCEIFLNFNFHLSYLCFTVFPNAIQTAKMTKKKPRFGAIPRLNMPRKSHEAAKPTPRPARSVVKEHDQQPKACYKSFSELCQRITGLKTLKGWKFKTMADRLIMKKTVEPFLLPEVEIMIDDSLAYTVKAFGCYLPEDHPLYVTHRRSVRNISVCEIVRELECYKLCCGVEARELTSQLFHHVIPINVDSLQACEQGEQFPNKGFWRSKDCRLMCEKEVGEDACLQCLEYLVSSRKTIKAKERRLSKPANVKAPVSKTDPERIKLTLQEQRLKCAELERELNEMRAAIVKTNIEVDHELSNDFTKILNEADDKITPFMSLFWQQQKKLFSSSRTGVRYHPMIIRFCLSLAAKSPSCYEELRNS